MTNSFFQRIEQRWAEGLRVCVGLDSQYDRIPKAIFSNNPKRAVLTFNEHVVKQTAKFTLCYKINIAFYSGKRWKESLPVLRDTVALIRTNDEDIPIILDAKRGDIGNTNIGYVEEAFDAFQADAVTVSPYFGMEAMRPFLDQKDKGIIVLCRTSNPGAGEFQDLEVRLDMHLHGAVTPHYRTQKLFEVVAERVSSHWNYNENCGIVVGATYPEELGRVRKLVGDMWILVPGIGTQGGDVAKVVKRGLNSKGHGLIINSSSGIIFAENPQRETLNLGKAINDALAARATEST